MPIGRNASIIEVFREECGEACQRLVDDLLRLEAHPDAVQEEARALMRIAHGLKGAAFAAGLRTTGEFVHDFESCADALGRGVVAVDAGSMQCLYDAVDAIPVLSAAELGASPPGAVELDDLFARLASTFGAHAQVRVPVLDVVTPDFEAGERGAAGSVRVAVAKLDRVLERSGDLLALRAALAASIAEANSVSSITAEIERTVGALVALTRRVAPSGEVERLVEAIVGFERQSTRASRSARLLEDGLRQHAQSLGTSADLLHEEVRSLRLVPIEAAFAVFAKICRDVGTEVGRFVDLVIEGGATEVDRDVLDGVREAIGHIVRNAIHHGIEPPEVRRANGKSERGTVRIRASSAGTRARVEVIDDGRGIDRSAVIGRAVASGLVGEAEAEAMSTEEALHLVFRPGISTANEVGRVSGRGIGLDAVRDSVIALGGRIDVSSDPGVGSRFVLQFPISRAALDIVLFECGGELVAVQSSQVATIRRVGGTEVARVDHGFATRIDGRSIRLHDLGAILGGSRTILGERVLPAVVLASGDETAAFLVDRVIDHRQHVIRGLGDHLRGVALTQGTTVLADGTVVPILDVEGILRASRDATTLHVPDVVLDETRTASPGRVLVVDDSITTRTLERSILESAGYEVDVATNGLEALDKLAHETIDLVLTDLEMPKMDGIELTRRVKSDEKTRAIPVVIVSSLGRPEDRERGLRAGADAYVVKGELEQAKLLSIVERLV